TRYGGGRARERSSRPTGSGGIGAAQRPKGASSGRAPRIGRPSARALEPADGVWGHRKRAGRDAPEHWTGPQNHLTERGAPARWTCAAIDATGEREERRP